MDVDVMDLQHFKITTTQIITVVFLNQKEETKYAQRGDLQVLLQLVKVLNIKY